MFLIFKYLVFIVRILQCLFNMYPRVKTSVQDIILIILTFLCANYYFANKIGCEQITKLINNNFNTQNDFTDF